MIMALFLPITRKCSLNRGADICRLVANFILWDIIKNYNSSYEIAYGDGIPIYLGLSDKKREHMSLEIGGHLL